MIEYGSILRDRELHNFNQNSHIRNILSLDNNHNPPGKKASK